MAEASGAGAVAERAQFTDRSCCIACSSTRLSDLCAGAFDEGEVAAFLSADPWGEDPMPFLVGRRWRYAQCDDCGQAFHRHILDPAWNERRITRWMTQEAIETFEARYKSPPMVFEQAARATCSCAEAGAADTRDQERCAAAARLRLRTGEFVAMCRLYGFDAIGVDRSSAKRSNASVPIVAGLDAVDGPFHAVTLFEVLEHLDDPRGALATLAPRLVRGGVLVLETPDCSGVTAIRTHSDSLKIHPLDHINGFTPQSLRHLAERVGFAPIDRPTAHVTAERLRVAKGEVKRVIGGLMRPTTQQYFRKT